MLPITRSVGKVFDKLGVPESERQEMYDAAQILMRLSDCS